ncbi:uncharacterized protein Dyak_GE28905 [Drosophila yakuba]|uniref:Secreted protein n=1 Tax=Drosophila yakuba TaxID=7245 RepID=A0A0R1DLQ8_DROYA|nr:uncharacterized protein Dyak_GE28905 [Drosophila yakuba]
MNRKQLVIQIAILLINSFSDARVIHGGAPAGKSRSLLGSGDEKFARERKGVNVVRTQWKTGCKTELGKTPCVQLVDMPDTDDYSDPDRSEATIKPGREIERSIGETTTSSQRILTQIASN